MAKSILDRLKDLERKNCCCRADIFVDEENLENVFPTTAKEGDWYVNENTGIYVFDGTEWISVVSGSGTTDGDKGDIVVSAGGTVWAIEAAAVTLAKQANVATGTVFYRKTAGAGAPEVQTLATLKTDLGLTGTNTGDQTTIVGITGTKAQFNTSVSDGDIIYSGDNATLGTVTTTGVIELGHASDTTIARSAAGEISVEGVKVLTETSTNIVTNKRVLLIKQDVADAAEPAFDIDNYNLFELDGISQDITSMSTNMTGTPINGDRIEFWLRGGSNQLITWGPNFFPTTIPLPTGIIGGQVLYVLFQYNNSQGGWFCLGVA